MSTSIIVKLIDDYDEWKIKPDIFVKSVREAWINAKISHEMYDEDYQLPVCRLKFEDHQPTFWLTPELEAIIIERGNTESVAEISDWFRRLIPAKFNVILCSEGGELELEIPPSANKDVIIKMLNNL